MSTLYAREFSRETSNLWDSHYEYNLVFLRSQQMWFNDTLKARGHLFLNEVWDALGLPRSKAGAVVGWWYEEGVTVDLGVFSEINLPASIATNSFQLNPNVQGDIHDLLPD